MGAEAKKVEEEAAAKAATVAKEAEEEAAQAEAVKAAREKLAQKFADVRTGGKGTVRRKKKAQHKTSAANTYVISGHAENKQLQELLPGIINQLGPDNLMNLKRIAESYNAGAAASGDAAQGGDNDVPEITEDFESVSKE